MRFIADFHSVGEDSVLVTTLDELDNTNGAARASWNLLGAEVLLDDAEGHTARGRVRSVEADGLIEIDVDWASWRDHALPGADAMFAWGTSLYAPHPVASDAAIAGQWQSKSEASARELQDVR